MTMRIGALREQLERTQRWAMFNAVGDAAVITLTAIGEAQQPAGIIAIAAFSGGVVISALKSHSTGQEIAARQSALDQHNLAREP